MFAGSCFDSDSDFRVSVQTLMVHTRITTHIKPTIAFLMLIYLVNVTLFDATHIVCVQFLLIADLNLLSPLCLFLFRTQFTFAAIVSMWSDVSRE